MRMRMGAFSTLALVVTLAVWAGAKAQGSAKPDRALGEYLSSECVTCHQLSGRAVGAIPPIIGWPEDQFIAVMAAYRNKDRDNNVMQTIAGKFKEDEIAALAAYFGSIKRK